MSYKLVYFDGLGRGEPIRMLFALAKVDFIDHRIQKADWPDLKPKTRWGVVPYLQVGDKEVGQTGTILRYLARKFQLAGADEWEAMRCDELFDSINDLVAELMKMFKEPEKKEELKKAFLSVHVPKFFGKMNSMQQENGGNWLVGKSTTWIDVYATYVMEHLESNVDKDVLDDYPNLKKVKNSLMAIPEIKAHVAKRPTQP